MVHAAQQFIERPQAMEWLRRWRNRDVIKVVTGIRRCGKSTVLALAQQELLRDGTPKNAIISLDIEKMAFDAPKTAKELYDLVVSQIKAQTNYVFIDEVQRVPEFEKAVDALFARDDVDLYITGSNSDLLSSELATLLTGRYVELTMLPLSFAEYRSAFPQELSDEELFNRYLIFGGMPYTAALPESDVSDYLDGVLSTILVKDVSLRHPRFNMMAIRSLAAFLADNIGNRYSLKTIANGLSRNGIKISPTTVGEYLDALSESYIVFEAKLYDAKSKTLLTQGGKYYLGDLGFRHLLLGRDQSNLGRRVENVVYLELLRRNRNVFVGRSGEAEIDFVAEGDQGTCYYQVALSVLDENTLARELASLQSLSDNYPKTLLTLDRIGTGDFNGIRHVNLIDWLLGREGA
ncbi:MAG TPA: ATP-binding protein [Slackia equolifaciens]|uniref:ATP-binding protein n=1 Tax=Slackia equolifaciens TaxID=498718 RepID=A0A9D2UXC2_9ACTN|nr:ATP-binding protein [Slackia equolifaciens]